jgi:hypothetical protein
VAVAIRGGERLEIECFIDGVKPGSAILAELGKLSR